jgi:hypothetical protein
MDVVADATRALRDGARVKTRDATRPGVRVAGARRRASNARGVARDVRVDARRAVKVREISNHRSRAVRERANSRGRRTAEIRARRGAVVLRVRGGRDARAVTVSVSASVRRAASTRRSDRRETNDAM